MNLRNSRYGLLFTLVLAMFISPIPAHATKPDADGKPILVETVEADVYVVAVAFKQDEVTGVQLAWIPDLVAEACVDQTLDDCEALYSEKSDSIPVSTPRRIVKEWVTLSDAAEEKARASVFNDLKQSDFVKHYAKSHSSYATAESQLPTLAPAQEIHVQLRWEVWPNGENFRVLKLLSKSLD